MTPEQLCTIGEFILGKLNILCPWYAEARVKEFEELKAHLCSEKLPSQTSKDKLLESAMNWAIALPTVYKDNENSAEINVYIKLLTELMVEVSSMKCGGS